MQQMPFQVGFPVSQRSFAQLAVYFLKEFWLVYIEIGARQLCFLEIAIPIQGWRKFLKGVKRGLMVCGLRITEAHIVQRSFREFLFHLKDSLRGSLRLLIVVPGQLEYVGHMSMVFLSRLLETLLRFQVIIAVGQPQATGADVSDSLSRIVIIGRGAENKRNEDGRMMEALNHA